MEEAMATLKNQFKQKQEQITATRNTLAALEQEEKQLQMALAVLSGQLSIDKEEEPSAKKQKQSKSWANQVEEEIKERELKAEESAKKKEQQEEEERTCKWYVIYDGPFKGLYTSWVVVKSHVSGKNIAYKGFENNEEALKDFETYQESKYKNALLKRKGKKKKKEVLIKSESFLSGLMTTSAKNERKTLTVDRFQKTWDLISNFQESYTTLGFYPRNRVTGPKVIIHSSTDPMTVSDFYISGLIDTIFIDDLKVLSELPIKLQAAVRFYKEKIAKGQEVFMKFYSSYPYIEGDKVKIKPFHLIRLGSSNKEYGTIAEGLNQTYDQEKFLASIMGVYFQSIILGSPSKENIKINYYGEQAIVYSNFYKKITEKELKMVFEFEEPFSKLSGVFEDQDEDLKRKICSVLKVRKGHDCPYCTTQEPEVE
ncbi:hypothetical protein Fmac_021444 [Flemingia macrophylla]|uniref:Ribonuclease H1 N-terminal domain-containing protein n=1 Tax=Flemingia macrophylla TaxID=520843 RepID=A0ABD1LWV5_9FABA